MEKAKFLKINCPRCRTEQTVYGRCSIKIKCPNCNKLLVKTTGGKTKIKAPINKILK